jgi:hypothetical protein
VVVVVAPPLPPDGVAEAEADGVNNPAAAGDVAVVVVAVVVVAVVVVAVVVVVAPPLPPDGVAETEAENVAGRPVEAVLDLAAVIDGSVHAVAGFGAEEAEESVVLAPVLPAAGDGPFGLPLVWEVEDFVAAGLVAIERTCAAPIPVPVDLVESAVDDCPVEFD